MPRLTHIIHPYFGRLPVNRATCPECGTPAGQVCFLMCPRSPAYQSADEEREEALRTEAEIAAVGFMAWDSAQHRAHGLPCPYDGYPENEYPEWEDGDTLTYEAHMDDEPIEPAPATTYVPDPGPWPDDDDLPF